MPDFWNRYDHFLSKVYRYILRLTSLLAEALFLVFADGRKETSACTLYSLFLKLKAVEMERELFDNDTLKELKNAEVLYCSSETLENIRTK